MNQSETIGELSKALILFQADMKAIPKTDTNPFFKSKYAGLPIVVETTQEYLTRHKLAVTQLIDHDGPLDILVTRLLHESGEWIEGHALLHLVKDDPQAHGSATTYGRRYGYMSILGLVADEDDDGNKPPAPTGDFTALQKEIKAHPKYQAMSSEEKGEFLSDAAGFQVTNIRMLFDEDAEQVLAKLRTL
jgi:hypothetical protein